MTRSVIRSMLLAVAIFAAAMASSPTAYAAPDRQASFVIDANTGKVLHAISADASRFPASLTKMMTLYMAFAEIEAGRMSYATKIKFSPRCTGMAPSKIGLDAGEEITAIEAIRVLVVKSANDVACAVAEHIGGTEYQFAKLMTAQAHGLGMKSTRFRNASGLPDPLQKSTARDMVTLGLRLQEDFPKHYPLFATTSVTVRGKTYKTHNALMRSFPGMDGIKTGYTRASGFNLVSSVRADGKHVVGAVFGGKTAKTRNALMQSLLYTALGKASTKKTWQSAPQLVAKAKPAKPQFAKASMDAKVKKAAPVRVAQIETPPVPAPVRRPVQAERPDPIADVLSEGEGDVSDDAVGTAPRLDLQALRQAMTDTGSVSGQAPPSPPQDIAGLIRHSIVEDNVAQQAPPARVLSDRQPMVRSPGTLGAQANALAMAAPLQAGVSAPRLAAERSHLKGPEPSPRPTFSAAPRGHGYEIQIGAYSDVTEAQAKLDHVRTRAVGLLEGHAGVTLPVQRDNRQIFRARYVHFDESTASHTCLELRRLAIDCFVMKAD